ncbi:MAG: YraN family protein [Candidatus Gracilibacteria bacterium]|nr:YraN family protein [Candidatus Gracilibacteria bacterium]
MKNTGDKGEIIAIKYLIEKGYKILDTNYKFGRFGEVDIIAFFESKTIFIEVKYRSSEKFGTGEESVNKQKLFKILKTIEAYCKSKNIDFEKIQFDVISIVKEEKSYKLTHYRNQSFQ